MSTAAQIQIALKLQHYRLTIDNVDSLPTSLKGWYALWVRYPFMDVLTCFYVGVSETNIRDRLLQHVRSSDNHCVKSMVYAYEDVYFSYTTKQPFDDVFGIEAQLIASMKPKCNEQPDPRIQSVRAR